MHSFSDGADEIGYLVSELRDVSVFADLAHNGASDDNAISESSNGRGLLGIRDSESYGHRHLGEGTDGGDPFGNIRREAGLLAGDAFARDVVDETLGGISDLLESIGGVVGAIRRMDLSRSNPFSPESSMFLSASWGGRSSKRRPSAPAAAASV